MQLETHAEAFKPLDGAAVHSMPPAPDWKSMIPAPKKPDARELTHYRYGKPDREKIWRYVTATGETAFYVCRFDSVDGGKEFFPLTYGILNGKEGWHWKNMAGKRLLYNAKALAERKDSPVLVCEGEKSADACQKLLPGYVAVTSSGGSNAAKSTDWNGLKGRTATIWPDNDAPGQKYAKSVEQEAIKAGAYSVVTLMPPEGKKQGWDAADALEEGWTEEQAKEFVQTGDAVFTVPDMGLLKGNRLPAPRLPLELLHPKWQSWVTLSAQSASCPKDYVALGLFTCLAGMIGNARRAMPWQGWTEPTILWRALVGNPSSGKSPALDCILNPIRSREWEMGEAHKETLKRYEADCETARIRYESWQADVKSAVKNEKEPPVLPASAEKPEKPPRPRIIIADSTIEKTGAILSHVPKGLLLYRDELAGLLTNLQRHGGDDRAFYIESYGGRPHKVDRVKHGEEPIVIPSLALSIIGGMQPDKMASILLKGDDDGLAARILYSWPERVAFKQPTEFPENGIIRDAVRILTAIHMQTDPEGKPQPKILPFIGKAVKLLAEWRGELADREAEANGLLLSHIGKMPGMAVRLATVLAYMEWIAEPEKGEPEAIGETHILSAIGCMDGYFLPMARRCFGDASLPQEQRDAITLARWIMARKSKEINAREMRRAKGSPLRDKKRLDAALDYLEESHWIRHIGGRDGERAGKQRRDYEIDPRVFEGAGQ